MSKKRAIALIVGLIIIGVVSVAFILRMSNTAGAIVYETEVSDASECTSYETFDAERSVCYFECANEQECDELAQAVDAEYESLINALESGSSSAREEEPAEGTEFSARYVITQGERISLSSGDDRQEFRTIWDEVAKLSPDQLSDQYIEEFVLYEDANDDTLAFVVDDDADGKWQYGINFSTHSQTSRTEQTSTLIHELAHIITLNNSQVKPDVETCATYQTDEGCATSTSYLNAFVSRFWPNTTTQEFTPDTFVTEYATTNPEEDLAESFAFYVLSAPQNGATIREQKVRFFEEYPELSEMRSDMRAALARSVIRERRLN